jgi:hypothetical protein
MNSFGNYYIGTILRPQRTSNALMADVPEVPQPVFTAERC